MDALERLKKLCDAVGDDIYGVREFYQLRNEFIALWEAIDWLNGCEPCFVHPDIQKAFEALQARAREVLHD